MPFLLLVVPVLSTFAGGLLAMYLRKSVVLLLALSAGLLLGAAFLDLLPEALTLATSGNLSTERILAITLFSFLVFYAFDTGLESLAARLQSQPESALGEPHRLRGRVAGSMLIFHSFRDGMAIGLSYAASHPVGYVVAIGIAAHDLGDGMNTVLLTTRGERAGRVDLAFLLADSFAPLLGCLLTLWWTVSAQTSAMLLAVTAGFFLQMAAAGLLPEIRRRGSPSPLVVPAIFTGAFLIYAVNLVMRNVLR